MSKDTCATATSLCGLPLGSSYGSGYSDDEFDKMFPPGRTGAGKAARQYDRNKNKSNKNKKVVKVMKQQQDDTSSVASAASSADSLGSSRPTTPVIKKTGKPMHQRNQSVELSHLHDIFEDEQDNLEGSGLLSSSAASYSSLPSVALKLERQLSSSSGDYIDYLDLSNTRYDWNHYPFDIKQTIGKVNLSANNLNDMSSNFLQFPQLRAISFAANRIKMVEMPNQMKHLTVLELQSNKISEFPSADVLANLPVLKKLILFDNAIENIPKKSVLKLAELGRIEEINISYNKLCSLPSKMGEMTSLTALRLSNNKLLSLPVSITKLNIVDSNFSIFKNHLSSPPQEVAEQGFSAVKRFFHERNKEMILFKKAQSKLNNPISSSSSPVLPVAPLQDNSGPTLCPEQQMSPSIAAVNPPASRSRANSMDYGSEVIKSSQFKMIVVGHETAGKTSCIRCLTRTVVYIKHMKQYGILLGRHGAHKYEIELIPHVHHDSVQQQQQQNSQPPSASPPSCHSTAPFRGDSWESSKNSTSKKNKANKPKVVYCSLDELKLCHAGEYSTRCTQGGQNIAETENVLSPEVSAKPLSTVGIDIDMWRPFEAHDFLTKYHEENERRKKELKEKYTASDKPTDSADYQSVNKLPAYSTGYYQDLHLQGSDDEDSSPLVAQSSPPSSGSLRKTPKRRSSQGQAHSQQLPQEAVKIPGGKHKGGRGGGTGRARKSSTGREKNASHPCPLPACDLVLSIWDFAGQEIYHAAQEAFFSERALYLVVWDMTKNSEKDMDKYVQFWIDLIQSRAPGSTIIVVGTHADILIKPKKRMLKKISNKSAIANLEMSTDDPLCWHKKALCRCLEHHLKSREKCRILNIENDLRQAENHGDVGQVAHLGYLLKNRPNIRAVFPVSCTTKSGFESLTAEILRLSKPTEENKTPFQLVNIYIPRFYLKVKETIELMRRYGNHIVTMNQLLDQISPSEDAKQLAQHNVNDVRDAISFLSSIGEVVWFQPPSADGSHSQMSDLKSDFDKKSDDVCHDEHVNPLPDKIPELGTRCSTSSGSTAHSGEEGGDNSFVREVEELEAHLNSRGDISDMVFLSPHWLIDVLKRVLTHHLVDTIRNFTTSMSESDLSRYFGDNHSEHAKNGIVRWNLIEEKLMRIQINSPVDTEGREISPPASKKVIIKSLMTLMLKFNIIIQLDMSNDADTLHGDDTSSVLDENSHSNTSIRGSKSHGDISALNLSHPYSPSKSSAGLLHDQSTLGGNTYFLVPALIDLQAKPLIPKVAPSGMLKFENTFRLENFLPPGLLQRIMSRTYFRYGNRHNVARKSSQRYRSNRNCWKSAFLQTFSSKRYGEISVWVWIQTEPENFKQAKQEKFSSDSASVNKSHPKRNSNDSKDILQSVETRGTVHISVFGNIFVCQELLKKLIFYSNIVSEVLSSFRSLCHVTQAMVCPVCSMEERRTDYGEFSQEDLRQVSADLREISKQKEEARAHCQNGIDQSLASDGEVSFEWTKSCRRRCPRQGCVVNPDYLVIIPPNLIRDRQTQSPLDQAQTTISFLMEEIVRLSSKPSAEILPSVCKVGIGFCKEEIFENFKNGSCSDPIGLYFPKNINLASGAVLDINSCGARGAKPLDDMFGEDVFVVTCEHLMRNPVTKKLNMVVPIGYVPVYLVGEQDRWLFVAEVVLQGSKYPNGRHTFATAMHSADYPQHHKASRPVGHDRNNSHNNINSFSNNNHSIQFENMSLDTLRTSTAPGSALLNTSQTTESLLRERVKSNTWNTDQLDKPPDTAWDVAAFKIFCKIKPTDGKQIVRLVDKPAPVPDLSSSNNGIHSAGGSSTGSSGTPLPSVLCPMFAAENIPEVEQTLRLISYQAMSQSTTGSVSICWGRINQILNRQLLVNFYSDYGSSGGAVLDRDGCLVGILSSSAPLELKQSAYIEPLYPLLNLLRSGIWKFENSVQR